MTKQLSEFERGRLVELSNQGKSYSEIALILGVSKSTVSRNVKKHKTLGSVKNLKGTGRPKKLSEEDIETLNKIRFSNPKTSLRKSSVEILERRGSTVSYSTIRNFYNNNNIYAFSPIKKPFLSKKAISTRFDLSKKFMFMDEDKVKRIIFSDESKFNLFYSDGKVSVWREPGTGLHHDNLTPTVKHGGGSIMVWGCFSYRGVGKLVLIDGKMDSVKYIEILSRNLTASAKMMYLDHYTFQQDNDPKHTSKLTKEFFCGTISIS